MSFGKANETNKCCICFVSMKNITILCFAAVMALYAVACGKKVSLAEINALEQNLEAKPSESKADSLVNFCLAYVKANPNDHVADLHCLTKAAEVKYLYLKDARSALTLLDEALSKHGAGQDLAEPIGLCARLLNAYTYRDAESVNISGETALKLTEYVEQNPAWADSSLARLNRQMGFPVVSNVAKAAAFVGTAEGYATLLIEKAPERYVDLMLKAAGLAKNIEMSEKSVALYRKVAEKMPNNPKAPMALFMTGFIYENDLGDLNRAKDAYESFLKKYPQDPDFADDAQMALQLLGKSPEEIIKSASK